MQRALQSEAPDFGTVMVTVRVGTVPHTVDFPVYERPIRKSSQFVDNALKEPWQESTDRVISLPKVRRNTFQIYHEWLLTGKLHTVPQPPNGSGMSTENYILYVELIYLSNALHLGYYLLDTDFTDTVCDGILQCTSSASNISFFTVWGSDCYKGIPYGEPARKLIVDLIAWTSKASGIRRLSNRHHVEDPDFVMDVLQAVAARFMSAKPSTSPLQGWETSCKYHCHGKDKPCFREKAKKSVDSTGKRPAPDDAESHTKRQRV
ncbi:hypothetical protein P153DRAFT_388207 [Dothidotthia symphoricarpi CBS 119687]|uniref:BTB domain-containing protein n=1 Tax=Dothidotthia symphoricarpi CBS 119687 TaxID=1392245 RepID=A0A6A6A7U5_9PLEO|nr:uncharacterized protein P153DRAFT_388207 [Dothidotthia symphoricarpi CBS 119687]KAF2126887.1 hypothetical protein P153DRAFT_388207 [Dothidotthia symphoricarpi CBS 119687]